MTSEDAINGLKNLRLFMELQDKMNKTNFNSFTYDCIDTGIQALKDFQSIKALLKTMKRQMDNCKNQDYATGYISAISTLEGYLSMLESENGGCENGEINKCWE
jgi:hypothetical protein